MAKLPLTCIGCVLLLAGLGIWSWLEMQDWLARSEILTPLFWFGLSRFLRVLVFSSCSFFLVLLLGLFAVYRACRQDMSREDAQEQKTERLVTRHSRAY